MTYAELSETELVALLHAGDYLAWDYILGLAAARKGPARFEFVEALVAADPDWRAWYQRLDESLDCSALFTTVRSASDCLVPWIEPALAQAFRPDSAERLSWMAFKAANCTSIDIARAYCEAAQNAGNRLEFARAQLIVARREFEAENPQGFLRGSELAIENLTDDDEFMQIALRYLAAAELNLNQFDSAFDRFGRLSGMVGELVSVRTFNTMGGKQQGLLCHAVEVMLFAGPATPHWVLALGGLAAAFPKKKVNDRLLWDLLVEQLNLMLDTSERPSNDLEHVILQAEMRQLLEVLELAKQERTNRDLPPDENPSFPFYI